MINMIKNFFNDLGMGILFLKEIAKTAVYSPCSTQTIAEQIYKVTIQSFSTTAMAGFFVGAIMVVQFGVQIKQFAAMGFLGGLATSGTVREVGPLLIAFMLSGKIGAYTAAELGTMKVTEQIDAIRCLGANPMQEIILPRFIGIVISSFLLLGLGLAMSVGGGMFMGILFAGISPEEYFRHIPSIVTKASLFSGLFKCFCFALLIATVCTYKGYTTTGGAIGVGRAVVKTAVITMVGIVLMDWGTSVISETFLTLLRGE